MKNLIKKSLLVVAVLTTIVMTGTELKRNANFTLIDAKLVNVSLQNNDGELQLRLKDTQGEILYKESFEGSLFTKKYDLNNLPKGEYFFEIEGQTKIKLMSFVVTSETVKFDNEIKTVYYKPVVRQDGDMVFISKVAMGEESMTIVLYDIDNLYVLYKEEINGDVNLGKKLNIKKLVPGSYKLVVHGENKMFTQYIEKGK